mmetsp:Transcript_17389/g.34711  ORF Transcript_17389/g.34711 Transcript_17389/m.34711 type:complete len:230 (-) Transcript_17389:2709-3398(-)
MAPFSWSPCQYLMPGRLPWTRQTSRRSPLRIWMIRTWLSSSPAGGSICRSRPYGFEPPMALRSSLLSASPLSLCTPPSYCMQNRWMNGPGFQFEGSSVSDLWWAVNLFPSAATGDLGQSPVLRLWAPPSAHTPPSAHGVPAVHSLLPLALSGFSDQPARTRARASPTSRILGLLPISGNPCSSRPSLNFALLHTHPRSKYSLPRLRNDPRAPHVTGRSRLICKWECVSC